LHALVHVPDRSGWEAPTDEIGDLVIEVVHGEVQKARAGAAGIEADLDPPGLGHSPFDELTCHWQVVSARPNRRAYHA